MAGAIPSPTFAPMLILGGFLLPATYIATRRWRHRAYYRRLIIILLLQVALVSLVSPIAGGLIVRWLVLAEETGEGVEEKANNHN